MTLSNEDKFALQRELVLTAFTAANAVNKFNFGMGDVKATAEYIFPNQALDAHNVQQMFYQNNRHVVSIQKKTKVGADGLMIEIAKLLTTHIDDSFIVDLSNVRIITGMSNASWQADMIEKSPECFKNKIFHHGKLPKADIVNMKNSLIIIDEIDTGDKECQRLHRTLKEAGVLDVNHMKKHNNRFVFISATMIRELYELYTWGELHELCKMTIPDTYIGHIDFLEKDIVQEFYALNTQEVAEKWVQEDILDNYGTDYRIHIVRVGPKTTKLIQNACILKNIEFKNHDSTDKIQEDELKTLFDDELSNHVVLGVKGLLRRANLIPNAWKLRIGAMHERHTKTVDNNVQIQGLIGRMTGYWRVDIEAGHKTGPYRTSILAIEEYEETYANPFGENTYHSNGFNKKIGKITAKPGMLHSRNILNLDVVKLPCVYPPESRPIFIVDLTDDEKVEINIKGHFKSFVRNYIATHTLPDEEYKEYEPHCWRMNKSTKEEKWGYQSMIVDGAMSTVTNITKEWKVQNTLMIYLRENKLIFSPWGGKIRQDEIQ